MSRMNVREAVDSEVRSSLELLAHELSVSKVIEAKTHKAIFIQGLEKETVISALAVYLVGLRFACIDMAGRICTELISDKPITKKSYIRGVAELVTAPVGCNDAEHWKSTFRDPWLTEAIWHCCMRVAQDNVALHPPGQVVAIDNAHISPKDHGFDVSVMYVDADTEVIGLSFIETKAYSNRPADAITHAAAMHKAIEVGDHDVRLRQMVLNMRNHLGGDLKNKLVADLWVDNCTHIPNPHYDASEPINWKRTRSSLKGLTHPVIIMPHAIEGFEHYFDVLANEMVSKAKELMSHV